MKSGSNLKNEDVMKKVLYMVMGGLLNAMCFSACNSDLLNTVGPEADEQADGKVTVAAIIVNEDDTKIALGDDTGKSTKVYWSPDDAIALVNGEERYVFERSDDKSESQTAEFSYDSKSGNLPSIQTAGLKFVYPCIEPASYAKQPGTKEGIGDYIGMEASVPAGVSEYEGIRLTFEHSAAIVKLVLNNDDFKNKKVTVRLYADGLMPEDNMIATEPIDADASGSVTAYIAIPASGIALKNCTIYASTDAGVYETSLSDKTLSAGRLYRISKNNLIESDSPISAKLPSGTVFNSAAEKFLDDNPALKRIRFIAASSTTGTQISTCNAYMVANGDWLEIHTPALEYEFNKTCSFMFSSLTQIIEIQFGHNINTSLVEDMSYMFDSCYSLMSMDIERFDTSSATTMKGMFGLCLSISSLELDGFDTSKVTGMQSMFYNCCSLTSLNLESFSFNDQCNFRNMFLELAADVSNKPIEVVVTQGGYDILSKASTGINSNYARLVVKNIPQAVPANQIWYTSQSQASFGSSPADSKILSHTFDEVTKKGVITFESDITTINNSAFIGNGSLYLETVSLPDGIESFGTSVFSQKGYLTTVNLPKKLQSIPDWTFLKCVKLADIKIPSSVKSIGYQAFYACTSIETITLPAGLQSIGASAFYGCSSLTSIYCESPVPPTGSDYMFAGHASGRKIYVPSGSAEAYKKAKYWSEYSTSIEEY